MKKSSLKKTLLQGASGIAVACLMAPAAHAVATNVGTATTVSADVTEAGVAFFFDTSGGVLTNTATITSTAQGATVSGTGVAAATVTNSGNIIASVTAAAAIDGVTTITNNDGATIQALGVDSVGISVTGTPTAAITNTGTITSANNGAAISTTASSTSSITNNASGVISNTASGVAIDVQDGTTSFTLDNAGTISGGTVVASAPSGTAATANLTGAIRVGTNVGTASVTNSGTITATLANAVGIDSASPITITNTGVISSTNAAGGSAINITASGTGSVITNSSSISSAGIDNVTIALGSAATLNNNAGGVISSTGDTAVAGASDVAVTITNAGTISTSSGVAVEIGAGSTLTNTATITGEAGALTVQASNVNDAFTAATVNNSGAITISTTVASNAVDLQTSTNFTNTGTISSANTGNVLNVATGVNTTITNSGTIETTAAGDGIEISQNIAQVTNSGTISATGGTAIRLSGAAVVASGITNSGTLQGATAYNNAGTGAQTFTNTGTITGNVVLGNAGADTFNVNGGTITGTITGNGANDTLNFGADFTSGGAINNVATVNLNTGTLSLNHAITGATTTTIATGTTLNLGADITSTNTNSTGNVNLNIATATNSTRTITGIFTQTASGTVTVGATDGGANSDVLAVTGNVNLGDGSTVHLELSGSEVVNGDTFQVITSGGAMTATPANLNLTSDNNFITLSGSTAGNNLTLTATTASAAQAASNVLTNNGIDDNADLQTLAGGGQGGQNATNSLTALSNLLPGLQFTDRASFNTVNDNINALEGVTLAEALEDLGANAELVSGNFAAVSAGSSAANNVMVARLDQARQQMLARKESGLAAGGMFGNDLQLWAQPYVTTVNQGLRRGIDGYDADVYGLLFGGDVQVDEAIRMGISFGYSDTDVEARGANGLDGSDVEGYNVNLYGTYSMDNWYIDGLLGYGWSDYETTNFNAIAGGVARGDFDGNQYTARIGGGYDLDAGHGFTITPQAHLQYTNIETDSYTQTGVGVLNANVGEIEHESLESSLGLKVAYDHENDLGKFVPYVEANWLNENGDDDQTVTNTFTGGGTSFVTTSAGIERSAINIGTGLDFYSTSDLQLGLHADYIDRDEVKALSGALRVRMPF